MNGPPSSRLYVQVGSFDRSASAPVRITSLHGPLSTMTGGSGFLGQYVRARIAELYSSDVAEGVRILYGGSVKASNIGPIMEQPDVDGALVGGASLEADEFAVLCRYRDHPPR